MYQTLIPGLLCQAPHLHAETAATAGPAQELWQWPAHEDMCQFLTSTHSISVTPPVHKQAARRMLLSMEAGA